MSKAVHIYDFDHTIYDGDASIDFILFSIKTHPKLVIFLPSMAIALMLYVLGLRTRKQIKQTAFQFLRQVQDVDGLVEVFWSKHESKIKDWYVQQKKKTDMILSASPEFLLIPIAKKLDVQMTIGTQMDASTGLIKGENCRGQEKVRRLKAEKPTVTVEEVYSDSLSDTPLFRLGKKAYLVKKGVFINPDQYAPSKLSMFKGVKFLRFLFVGGVSAAIGIGLSFGFSLVVESPQLAFIVGFLISLIPSYFLNSLVTFKDTAYSYKKFLKFVVSYIPNFLIQLILVHGITNILTIPPLATYIIAVGIGVPVTFALLSVYTFSKRGV